MGLWQFFAIVVISSIYKLACDAKMNSWLGFGTSMVPIIYDSGVIPCTVS